MVAVPTPYQAVAGAKVSAAAFNAGVQSTLQFLLGTSGAGFPRVHAYDSTGVVMTNATLTLLTLDNETYDNDSMHSTSSNTSRIVFTTAGLYDIDIFVSLPSAAYTALQLRTSLNAAGVAGGGTTLRTQNYPATGTTFANLHFRFNRVFAAADYIEAFVLQTSGANQTTAATSLGTRVFARWLSIS